ncbi:unnamed protein product, partial [Staurois parvus]
LSPGKTYRLESLCTCSVCYVNIARKVFFFSLEIAYIVSARSRETRYCECRVQGDQIL